MIMQKCRVYYIYDFMLLSNVLFDALNTSNHNVTSLSVTNQNICTFH